MGQRKMNMPKRIIRIGRSQYWIYTKDDVIDAIHRAYRDGHSIEEIAEVLHISKKKVIEYLEEC